MTIPIRDAIMIFRTELEARSKGYYDYLGNGGRGDCAEEARLDALQLVIEVLEKQIPKNAELEVEEGEYAIFLCPNCNGMFHTYIDKPHYCEHCGQVIDWSDTE